MVCDIDGVPGQLSDSLGAVIEKSDCRTVNGALNPSAQCIIFEGRHPIWRDYLRQSVTCVPAVARRATYRSDLALEAAVSIVVKVKRFAVDRHLGKSVCRIVRRANRRFLQRRSAQGLLDSLSSNVVGVGHRI